MRDPTIDRISSAVRAALDGHALPTGASRLHAIGWATVDLDRAVEELAGELGISIAALGEAPGSPALGARCRVAVGALPHGLSLAVLEPRTEGRLAASLARFGEGPAAVWYVALEDGGAGTSPARPGPFGPERLVPGDPVHGPHRLLIAPGTGTIQS